MPSRLLTAWNLLGGPPVRGNRANAFWRNSKDLNISVNFDKNVWYDFAMSEGGGPVKLVANVLGVSLIDAAKWLQQHTGEQMTTREKYSATERSSATLWRRGMLAWLEHQLEQAKERNCRNLAYGQVDEQLTTKIWLMTALERKLNQMADREGRIWGDGMDQLMQEFRAAKQVDPAQTKALIRWAIEDRQGMTVILNRIKGQKAMAAAG